jgi:hypothetical protein
MFLEKGHRYVAVGNSNGLITGTVLRLEKKINFIVKLNEFNFPVVNYVIIVYPDKKEVLFGWDYDKAHMAQVFISEDASIVNHFEGLFASALENSTDWEPPPVKNQETLAE